MFNKRIVISELFKLNPMETTVFLPCFADLAGKSLFFTDSQPERLLLWSSCHFLTAEYKILR
jgi:hypothetical protein